MVINHYRLIGISALAAMGGLLFGFDTGIIADTQWQLTDDFSLSALQWSLIVSCTVLGAFISSLFSGFLADWWGRKNTLIFVSLGFIASTLLLAFASSYWHLILGRFLIGIFIGIASFATPLYLSEISPAKFRGAFVLFYSVAITGGECISFLVGYSLFDPNVASWRYMFLVGVVPALILLAGMFFMPSSPRWLFFSNKKTACREILEKLRITEIEVSDEIALLEKQKQQQILPFKALFQKPYGGILCLAISLGILQQACGINAVMYYGPHIFQTLGMSNESALMATFIMGLTNCIFTIFALLVVDHFGRKNMLLYGGIGSCIALALLSIGNIVGVNSIVLFLCLFVFIIHYAIGLGSIFWLFVSEIFPYVIRAKAMSITVSAQWLTNFLVALLFIHGLEAIGPAFIFAIFAMFCLLSVFITYYFVPETKQMSLEDIEKKIMSGMSLMTMNKRKA